MARQPALAMVNSSTISDRVLDDDSPVPDLKPVERKPTVRLDAYLSYSGHMWSWAAGDIDNTGWAENRYAGGVLALCDLLRSFPEETRFSLHVDRNHAFASNLARRAWHAWSFSNWTTTRGTPVVLTAQWRIIAKNQHRFSLTS